MLAATGAVSPVLVVVVIVLGLALVAIPATALSRSLSRRAERLDALASALQDRRPPPHLLPNGSDAMGRAERHLLDAADSIVDDVDSLAEQRDEFEAILRSMAEAVVVTGARGEVILLNGAARRIFALGADTDYRARPFVELCRDPRLQEFAGRSMRSTDNEVMSAEIMIQNPAPLHVSASAAQIRTSRGAAWVFVFHDITQLKAYETLRADFISNLTHELRTPLSALYGYAETLLQGVDDRETATRFLRIIERQARRLARLLDDLVSLSDLERGLTPLKIEQLEPSRVLSEAAELMQEQAGRRGLRLLSELSRWIAEGGRRSRPAASGDAQFDRQRDQVHAARRPCDGRGARNRAIPTAPARSRASRWWWWIRAREFPPRTSRA